MLYFLTLVSLPDIATLFLLKLAVLFFGAISGRIVYINCIFYVRGTMPGSSYIYTLYFWKKFTCDRNDGDTTCT